MRDFSEPRVMAPVDEDSAGDDPRRSYCLPLSADDAMIFRWLTDPKGEREAIVNHHKARFVAMSQQERQVLDDINERLPASAQVAPFSLLPPAVWETELEARLMSWGLVPVHPYLNMYLPVSDGGNPVLHLPAAPQTYPDSYTEGALRELHRICNHYGEACAALERPQPDDACALADWLEEEEALRLDAVEEILMLAEFLARRLLGNEIVERHEGLFGAVMKKAMGFPPGLLMERV
ncbi:hypothetical protein [Thermopetrobacter sp. TC1]|uniref:hypothetical protein n=1 Tax=Thermopetrobacter sp. TC1 TaxID=1495045 RepID=UPI00056DF907|nr:hypothetical protein [Thermopetrobacter sp. TC1]